MSAIIEAKELSRWYGLVMGLNNVTFQIEPGITGLVGPNGAGKSTLIQIITGQLQPSSGELLVFGDVPWDNPELLRRIGYCPEGEAMPKDFNPLDWLIAMSCLAGIEAPQRRSRCEAILDRVGLARAHWSKKMGKFSKGMKQRVKLAQGLLHEPDLLVLDEPMNGLDPMGRQEIATIIKTLAAEGVSVIISSHILAELEALCKNIVMLNWGRVLASGAQKDIRGEFKHWSESLSIECDSPEKLAKFLFAADMLLGFDLDDENQRLDIRIRNAEAFYKQWTQLLVESGVRVFAIRSQSRSLKHLFEKVTA